MECYKIEGLTFKYPTAEKNALQNISLTINSGEFVTICGRSGSGKSTLIKHLKPILAPHGNKEGKIYFNGRDISCLDFREQTEKIAFVSQSPDNQLVTDKVWHELSFALESLGMPTEQIRARVAEMASFFGIQTWFHKNVNELSGGQKQLLNLASAMVIQPSVLILDEPTSQLDPIAAQDFLEALAKINRETGVTVIMTEHRLEEALSLSDRAVVMDGGAIIADGTPSSVGKCLSEAKHDMFSAFPASMRIYSALDGKDEYPVTVRDGRLCLDAFASEHEVSEERIPKRDFLEYGKKVAAELKNVFFRYEKNMPDVIKNLSLKIYEGELCAIVGGNGTGKTTALSLIGGQNAPQRGSVLIQGKPIAQINDLYNGCIGMLPQNPQMMFVKKTVRLDLYEMLSDKKMTRIEKDSAVSEVCALCSLEELLDMHPYDLSGGEQQRAAIAKLLLLKPRILLLDEPTKGLDAHFKMQLAQILGNLKECGVTIVMVSHDIEFCAEYADRCAMLFDGAIVSKGAAQEFFAGNSFYTTAANRIARHLIPKAVTVDDVAAACGAEVKERRGGDGMKNMNVAHKESGDTPEKPKRKPRIFSGAVSALLFVIVSVLAYKYLDGIKQTAARIASVILCAISVNCFIPQSSLDTADIQTPRDSRKIGRRTVTAAVMALVAMPLTVYFGVYFFGDRKYYFISLLIILEALIPFFVLFEKRRPQVSEIVTISVLCAIAVAGRAAFYMLPQFKPTAALVIISGVCFGGETGFLVGAVTAFVSNFFFGQGPWTPWQMLALGLIGFFAGVLFKKGFLRKTKGSLCIFGFLAVILIYGGIMNPASVIMSQQKPNTAMLLSSYAAGLPFDLIHAVGTVFFLWLASRPMIEKLDRIKIKYGIIE